MTESRNDGSALIPSGLVAILASTNCFNPLNLLSLGYSGALTEQGLVLSRRNDAASTAQSAQAGCRNPASNNSSGSVQRHLP